jgi:D-alanine-D-alanine ligase
MKICVLQPSYRDSESCIADVDIRRDLTALLPEHDVSHLFLDKATAIAQLRRIRADVCINLCDGAWDEDTPGLEVVMALERENRAFTGAGSSFYDPTREMMKEVCYYWGVETPAHVFARTEEEIALAADTLRLPCIVKPEHGYNSVGITERSRVETREQLRTQARGTIACFGGALIEEFIEGREFSVLVAGDPCDAKSTLAYRPIEHRFEAGVTFKTFDYKWRSDFAHHRVPVEDEALAQRLQEMTAEVFLALQGTGYARSDIRMDRDSRLFVLEINPNCSLFYRDDDGSTADDILLHDGIGKAGFLRQMIAYALARQERVTPRYRVRRHPTRGNGLYAARAMAAGERIYGLEEQPHVLVSRAHVERTWNARDREFFRHYAYPVTDDLFVLWDADPRNWKPINHSCEPNAWVTGLDLCARRPLARDEEITLDYATMYTERQVDYACHCGSPLCRGMWRGDDHLQPWFQDRYGDHVTDYVRQRQRQVRR